MRHKGRRAEERVLRILRELGYDARAAAREEDGRGIDVVVTLGGPGALAPGEVLVGGGAPLQGAPRRRADRRRACAAGLHRRRGDAPGAGRARRRSRTDGRVIPPALVAGALSLAGAIVGKLPPADPETRRARIAADLQLRLARLAAKQERWRAAQARRAPREGGGR